MLRPENVEQLRASEHFKGLLDHPGWKLLVEAAQPTIARQWSALLAADGKEMPRLQGFIEGANFILEYGRAAINDAQRVIDQHRRDQEAALEEARTSEAFQFQRTNRRARLGASID